MVESTAARREANNVPCCNWLRGPYSVKSAHQREVTEVVMPVLDERLEHMVTSPAIPWPNINDALPAGLPMMSDTADFEGPFKNSERIQELSTTDISHKNGKNPRSVQPISDDGSPMKIENVEITQNLSSQESPYQHIRNPEKIEKPAALNDLVINIKGPECDTPTPPLNSLNGHMTSVNIPLVYGGDPERIYIIQDSSLDEYKAIVDVSIPNHNASPKPIPDSTREDHMKLLLDPTYNNPTLESTLKGQYHSEYVSDCNHHPESLNGNGALKARAEKRRLQQEAKLHTLHSRNLQTRTRLYEKRSQLRQSRFEISIADEMFMKLIREKRNKDSHDDLALEASFKRLQATRDVYGPLEEAYNVLEERLDREEYEATELEEELQKPGHLASGSDSSIHSGSLDSDSEAPRNFQEHHHPLFEEYLSRLGDADLCREAHSDLVIEYENLLEAKEVRQSVGKILRPEDQTTLADFPAKNARILEDLRGIEADVERLRRECIREGIMGEDEIEEKDEEDEIDILKTSRGGAPNPDEAEYNKYPLLLQKPGEDEDEEKSKSLLSVFKQGDTGDRITRWLLHKLRSSCSEVELLARFSEQLGSTEDNKKWQEEVLDFWFVDSANLSAEAYQPAHTAFPFSPLTDGDKGSPIRINDANPIGILLLNSSLSRSLIFRMWLKLRRIKGSSAMTV